MARNKILIFPIALLFQMCVNHDLVKPIDCAQSGLILTVDSVAGATSCSVSDGKIYAAVTGGKAPYAFSINNEVPQSSPVFNELPSGIYTISVHDTNGCVSSIDNISVLAKDFLFSADITADNNCLNHNGAVTVNVNASNPPFLFKLNNETFSDLNSFAGLKAGQYSVTVKDNIDCTVQLSITIPRGYTNTSWSNDILPIMKASCALNGCHDGKTRFNYKDYATAKRDALSIKVRTQDGSMPFDGTPLPQSQIDLIACWVDDGAPDN